MGYIYMKRLTILFFPFLLLAGNKFSLAQKQSIGGYKVFYGLLHNHSNVIEGLGTPQECYYYAKTMGRLDFFGITDHDFGIDTVKWITIKEAAEKFNKDGVFATFWGFEWSSDVGHVAVINSNDFCSCQAIPTDTFSGLVNWLQGRECVAFFNHPGREDGAGNEFGHFSGIPSEKFVGIELWNGRNDFSRYYYNDGYYPNDGNKSFYSEANERGWRIGASGSEDNHRGDPGNYTQKRLAILADTLTRVALYNALKERRFYSTLDKNLALSFKIGGKEMGNIVKSGNHPIQIQATDATNDLFTMIQLYKNGSLHNTWHTIEYEINIKDIINTSDGDYYYVKVTQEDGNEAISSPLFISDK